MKKTLFLIATLFFSFPLSVGAFFSCEDVNTESNSSQASVNEELESFLQEKVIEFRVEAEKIPDKQSCNRSQTDRVVSAVKSYAQDAFSLEEFVLSTAAFYNNSCLQRDSEKLLRLNKVMQRVILHKAHNCYSEEEIAPMQNIQSEVQAVYKVLRDREKDSTLSLYWKEDLYGKHAASCPSESWQAVTEAWCELKNNAKNLKSLAKETKEGLGDPSSWITEELEVRAEAEARAYLEMNLPYPFTLKSRETDAGLLSVLKSAFKVLTAPIQAAVARFDSDFYDTQNTQGVIVEGYQNRQSFIKLTEITDLLEKIEGNYGKSYAAQLDLESEIRSFARSVEATTAENHGDNLRAFIKTLHKTEDSGTLSCSVNIAF